MTLILCQEKTLHDHIYNYWLRFSKHLDESSEAKIYQHTWTTFQILTNINETQWKSLGFRENSKFLNRLVERAKHTNCEWLEFKVNQAPQHEIFKKSTTLYVNLFVYKYFIFPPKMNFLCMHKSTVNEN